MNEVSLDLDENEEIDEMGVWNGLKCLKLSRVVTKSNKIVVIANRQTYLKKS